MTKVVLNIVFCMITLVSFAQKKRDSIYIHIKKDSCLIKRIDPILDYKKGYTHYVYEIKCFIDEKKVVNPIYFYTKTSFMEDTMPPLFKSRDLIVNLNKRKIIYTPEDFIKMGKVKTLDFFAQSMNNNTRLFIIDEMESDKNTLYIREVSFLMFNEQ